MGQEARCNLRIGRKRSAGKALLETDELIFRGDVRLAIPFREIRTVSVEDGELVIDHSGGRVVFELGPNAEKWAQKIRHPKGLFEKLGVRHGLRVAVHGIEDAAFLKELEARAGGLATLRARAGLDLVFLGVAARRDLARLASLERAIQPAGGIWVVWPKGRETIREGDVIAAGREAGLKDVKVVKFSEALSALKFVIPVARR